MFLRACRNYGMNEVDVFQTQDLYETKSMYTVSIYHYYINNYKQYIYIYTIPI